jgi:hypothetical protein
MARFRSDWKNRELNLEIVLKWVRIVDTKKSK